MNEVTIQSMKLPTNIEDLSKFVLIGRERLNAVRAEIRAIQKVGLAKEVAEQKRKEAQALAEAVIDAEVKIGELMREIPKTQGVRTELLHPEVKKLTKAETLEANGFNVNQGNQFEQMSKHPEAVAEAKAEAREADEVVTRSAVLEKIKAEKKRLEKENEELKKIVVELKDREPEVRVETVEVTPTDYKEAKAKATAYDKEVRRLNEKLNSAYKEQRNAEEKISRLQEELTGYSQKDYFRELDTVAIAFESHCEQFIRWVGGYIWITQNPGKLKAERKESVTNAVQMVYEWAGTMLHNLSINEGDKNEESGTNTESRKYIEG